jgi:hypothetical protein
MGLPQNHPSPRISPSWTKIASARMARFGWDAVDDSAHFPLFFS